MKPTNTRKRQILRANDDRPTRPIRTEARARLLKAIAQGRHWLGQLMEGRVEDNRAIAAAYDVSEKTVRSTLSLAFPAPDIVQAAIDGKLPHGLGVSQMTALPSDGVQQRQQIGIG